MAAWGMTLEVRGSKTEGWGQTTKRLRYQFTELYPGGNRNSSGCHIWLGGVLHMCICTHVYIYMYVCTHILWDIYCMQIHIYIVCYIYIFYFEHPGLQQCLLPPVCAQFISLTIKSEVHSPLLCHIKSLQPKLY